MKIYTCTDHEGHWPVPVASVIVAKNAMTARELLSNKLREHNLDDDSFSLEEIDITKERAVVLSDGEY